MGGVRWGWGGIRWDGMGRDRARWGAVAGEGHGWREGEGGGGMDERKEMGWEKG